MLTRIFSALCLTLCSATLHGQETLKPRGMPVPFPGLTTFVIAGGESAMPEQISYDPAFSELLNESMEGGKEGNTNLSESVKLISTRLNRENESRCLVYFNPGPSADPFFIITDQKTGKEFGTLGADSLILPGNGFIYSIGRSNNMHEERRKFAVRDGKLVEIRQPFSYVGLETKCRAPLTLTAEKGAGEVVASLAKGDPLQVVIRDGGFLLIRSRFGLVGWWKMRTDATPDNAEIEGIYYAGD